MDDRDAQVMERFETNMKGVARLRVASVESPPALNADPWPASLDLEALAEREPQAPKFIMPGWLPCGYASLFAGHGGVGKSGLALHMAVCMAAGIPFFGLEVERRRVMYLSCEDRENILHWRLARICAYTGVDLASLRGRLEVLDLVGRDSVLWQHDPVTGSTLTRGYFELKARVEQYGTEVLVLDGVSDTYAGNENSRPDVKRFVNSGLALIPVDNGAVVLISHVPKPTASGLSTSEGYSGSTAWHNSVRARWYLYPETEDGEDDQGRAQRAQRTGNLILELQKSNFGPIDQSMRFGWDDDAKMLLAQETVTTRLDRNHRDTEERDSILRAIQGCARAGIQIPAACSGPRTTLHVLRERPEFPKTLGNTRLARARSWRHIEYLRQFGFISDQQHRGRNRHEKAMIVATGKALEDARVRAE